MPPITATSPNLPETSDAITLELRKQDSLLNQIHSEMNAGYVTKKREEQLWEVQRIITQLKRKLRTFEKKADAQQQNQQRQQQQPTSTRSLDDTVDAADLPSVAEPLLHSATASIIKPLSAGSDDDSQRTATAFSGESTTTHANNTGTKSTPHDSPDNAVPSDAATGTDGSDNTHMYDDPSSATSETLGDTAQLPNSDDQLYVHAESGLLLLPATHPDCQLLLRLQLENVELDKWKAQLQERINTARAQIVWLRTALRQMGDDDHLIGSGGLTQKQQQQQTLLQNAVLDGLSGEELSGYERIVARYAQENALLEHKKQLLVREVFEENVELIQMQVDYSMKHFKY